jgi:multidrug efflux pump subunit AcrB
VKQFENGPPVDAPVAVRIVGPEVERLRTIAAQVERVVKAHPGTRDVDNPVRLLRTDLDLNIDTQKAALLGVPPVEADRTVRMAIAGLSARPLPRAERRRVRDHAAAADGRSPDDRGARRHRGELRHRPPGAAAADLDAALRDRAEPDPAARPRAPGDGVRVREARLQHRQGQRGSVRRGCRRYELPPGYRFEIAGEAEAQEETFGGILPAVLVAVFGILAVLVLEFGSFRSTLIVAGVVPLGITARCSRCS